MSFSAFLPFTVLVAFQLLGELAVRALRVPIPGAVMGALLLFLAMLAWPRLHRQISTFSHTLLRNMLLFYVPACAGITKSIGDIASHGLLLAAAVIISTWAAAISAAFLLDAVRRPHAAAPAEGLATA